MQSCGNEAAYRSGVVNSKRNDVVWLTTSPSLSGFDQPLLRNLAKRAAVTKWQYKQEQDEACSLESALAMLHHHLKERHQPVHLMGHGINGALALLYTRRYPEQVRSLTLLAVAEQPAVTWHAHYYVQRHLLPCAQSCVLAQLVTSLFKGQRPYPPGYLTQALAKDLSQGPLLHSLRQIESLPQGGVEVPMMVCGATNDVIVHPLALEDWQQWLKPGDRQWLCQEGGHFFHYFHAARVGREVAKFWRLIGSEDQLVPSVQTIRGT